MKEKIQSIKLNGMLCIIFIAITYLVTLNIENGFFQPDLWWMSNNFALTVSGGIATGFVAGLAYAIQEYRNCKSETEAKLFFAAGWLYSTFSHMDKNITEALENPQQPAIESLLKKYVSEGNQSNETIKQTEYITLLRNELKTNFADFKREECIKVQKILMQAYYYYDIAFNETKIDDLRSNKINRTVLISDPKVKRILEILRKEIEDELPRIESLAEMVDRQTRKKYHWEEYKKYSDVHCASVTKLNDFDEFLKRGGIL